MIRKFVEIMKIGIVDLQGLTGVAQIERVCRKFGHDVHHLTEALETLPDLDFVIIPGGASFGDYLYPGRLARASRFAGLLRTHAQKGKYLLGIGNGFQMLCEFGILPGALLPNPSGYFCSETVKLKIFECGQFFFKKEKEGQVLKLPLACSYGRYYCPGSQIQALKDSESVALVYTNEFGDKAKEHDVTNSVEQIAGVYNTEKNVLGIMVHPERALDPLSGNADGLKLFENFLQPS